ncbi:MAG: heme biosynthesis protein [Desulfatitalea sp. BRH_c12]|nr:MAG: heme biosynthesis protein [Desulfatitalea sp. BRH_c12]
MTRTVHFSKNAANVFFHILTQCNLRCRHCYINPSQHGQGRLGIEDINAWLRTLAERAPAANLIFLGGEPTLHPDLPEAVRTARGLGYGSITIDTNGYLFNDILERTTPALVDVISFSLDGASAATNDPIRGQGSFEACTDGIRRAKAKGFQTSLIFTVSRLNLEELAAMPALLADLGIDRFFIQVIGLRGQSAVGSSADAPPLQVSRAEWENHVFAVAAKVSRQGIRVIYPKVYLAPDEPFDCAGRVADNYFVFPNGRVYRCPLCEDYPLHSLSFENSRLVTTNPLNENDLFNLNIAEGCVMNKLIQPQNLTYLSDGRPAYKIACCLLKEERDPTT